MTTVEVYYVQGTLVLRSKGAELLILPQHVEHLQTLKDPKPFVEYFKTEGLVNRPARKLFLAWERNDPSLWNRLYATVQKNAGKANSETTN